MIKANFTTADIQNVIKQHKQQIENLVIRDVQIVAETFIKNARENGTYKDQTGNLRS